MRRGLILFKGSSYYYKDSGSCISIFVIPKIVRNVAMKSGIISMNMD